MIMKILQKNYLIIDTCVIIVILTEIDPNSIANSKYGLIFENKLKNNMQIIFVS